MIKGCESWHIIKVNRKHAPYDIMDGKYDRDGYEGYIARHLTKENAEAIIEAMKQQRDGDK
jgi:hypothetical protein